MLSAIVIAITIIALATCLHPSALPLSFLVFCDVHLSAGNYCTLFFSNARAY